jgi:hypothetical protein
MARVQERLTGILTWLVRVGLRTRNDVATHASARVVYQRSWTSVYTEIRIREFGGAIRQGLDATDASRAMNWAEIGDSLFSNRHSCIVQRNDPTPPNTDREEHGQHERRPVIAGSQWDDARVRALPPRDGPLAVACCGRAQV